MPTKPKTTYEYGRSPNPTNWHEAADAIRSNAKKPKKSSGFMEKMTALEKLIKDKK